MVEKAGELLKDYLSAVKQREQEKLEDVISKTHASKDEAGLKCGAACRKVCWVTAGSWLGDSCR